MICESCRIDLEERKFSYLSSKKKYRTTCIKCRAAAKQQRKISKILEVNVLGVADCRVIPYPFTESEFEIQAEIYAAMKLSGYDIRGEVVGSKKTRLDLVIYRNKLPILIIECKKGDKGTSRKFLSKKKRETADQSLRYQFTHGIPCKIIKGIKEAREFIAEKTRAHRKLELIS